MQVILLATLLALQPATPPVGQRTQTPESMLAGMGLAPDQDDLAAAIAAAAAHPLGSRENPVRVGGPDGERAYIARLRCGDGSTPRVGPRGSMGEGAFGSIVDGYPLDCGAASPGRTTLVMDMYHEEHRETRAPDGFTLVSQ
jgi:hypothetical protein